MENRRLVVLAAALALVAVVSTTMLAVVCHKVRKFNERYGCNVAEGIAPRPGERLKAKRLNRTPRQRRYREPWYENQEETPRAKSPEPSIEFADGGRYLPACGGRRLRIESACITNIDTEIRRIAPQNLVMMLALENDLYPHIYTYRAASELAENFSGESQTGRVEVAGASSEKTVTELKVAMDDGGPANGFYRIGVSGRGTDAAKVVCVTDIGLSVRTWSGHLGVWATSLTTGKPLAKAAVKVYSTANIQLAEGTTDGQGWCEIENRTKSEPSVVVVVGPNGDDMTFMALARGNLVRNPAELDRREPYLEKAELTAFVSTERGIYRHGEKMLTEIIVRNGEGRAPGATPVRLSLVDPLGKELTGRTALTDVNGVIVDEEMSVPAAQPSGTWKIRALLPGEDRKCLGERTVRIEEFVPPQIRVRSEIDRASVPSNVIIRVAAEHLFGGPAAELRSGAMVTFADAEFAPAEWKGYVFGDERRGLRPNLTELDGRTLDARGEGTFTAAMAGETGEPKSAVGVTVQTTVFEDGGRAVCRRETATLHQYPYYLGAKLEPWLRRSPSGTNAIEFVCVSPQGRLVGTPRKLVAKLEKLDYVYSYRWRNRDSASWSSERVRKTVLENLALAVGADGRARLELPFGACGDYALSVEDPESGVAFSREFYLSDWGEESVSARMEDTTRVTIVPDRKSYRAGEAPRLVIRSPFAGYAMVSVSRDRNLYTEIHELTNATSEITISPLPAEWAPNVDVAVSVVQSVEASARHLAACAHGVVSLPVRPAEREIEVKLDAEVRIDGGEAAVSVELEAPGAEHAVVTLVDEGINLLTNERVPNPIARFAAQRKGEVALYDFFDSILPVCEDGSRVGGVKTGGGFDADLLGRVSPVPSRRFKPLARWDAKVALAGGRGRTVFKLPEFKGEIRVTAIVASPVATGSAAIHRKVSPKLVMQADAPRFVAPGDRFDATLTLRNCSQADGEASYAFANGSDRREGRVFLRQGESTNLLFACAAGGTLGEKRLDFAADGYGERHADEIDLPVRPATAWRTGSEVVRLEGGATCRRGRRGAESRLTYRAGGSQLAEYTAALDWLAEYPHGCLEQTCSRIFPLITADGIFNRLADGKATNRVGYVAAGVRRVLSMMDSDGFRMWPDCDYYTWDLEVAVYAAHFLIEARKAGARLSNRKNRDLQDILEELSMSDNLEVAAYACHTLALAGNPNRDRAHWLYDRFFHLSQLGRARLARGLVADHDEKRAATILKYATAPASVKEAAFLTLAMLELNADDPRIPALVDYLVRKRDRGRMSWGTTADNAHALLAIGAYYARHPVKGGEVRVADFQAGDETVITNCSEATAFVTIHERWLEPIESVTNEANGISIGRRYLKADGSAADMTKLCRGDFLVAELTLGAEAARAFNDLVIEDLLPAAFEPVIRDFDPAACGWTNRLSGVKDWVMRTDARDDRVLIFSKRFEIKDNEAKAYYPVRVVSSGDFTLPGPVVEAMYDPRLGARGAPDRVVVRH